jgi:sulfhydrogenase subunit gamma (sulfur reductase)
MESPSNSYTVQWLRQETLQMKVISLGGMPVWSFIPGQIAILGVSGVGESYYAIASAPEDKDGMEFLVKDGAGVSGSLYQAKAGDPVQAKGPVGKGFPIENYRGRDFLITAIGSAMAPMRSVLRSICRHRQDFGKISFIYGARLAGDFPFLSEVNDWRKAGVQVVLSASRAEGTDWTGAKGHVQAHFARALAELSHPVALICGMKAMQQQSRDELVRLGVLPDEILTNF